MTDQQRDISDQTSQIPPAGSSERVADLGVIQAAQAARKAQIRSEGLTLGLLMGSVYDDSDPDGGRHDPRLVWSRLHQIAIERGYIAKDSPEDIREHGAALKRVSIELSVEHSHHKGFDLHARLARVDRPPFA